MGNAVIYEITNIKTGEKYVGTAQEMGQRFGVTHGHICKLCLEGKRLRLDWKIERVGMQKEIEKTNNGSIPYPLQEEWDKVTAPFKRLSEKKASRALLQTGEQEHD
jgi:hypothetical protein